MYKSLLQKIANQLQKKKIPYMVIGGQAVLLYGRPRLTKDIDITVGIGVEELHLLKEVVQSLHLKILTDNPDLFVKRTMVFPVIDKRSGIRVDFILSYSTYEQEAILNAKPIKFGKVVVHFASLEDIVVHKLIAGREKDIEDVEGILIKAKNINSKYVIKWLKEFESILNKSMVAQFTKLLKENKH